MQTCSVQPLRLDWCRSDTTSAATLRLRLRAPLAQPLHLLPQATFWLTSGSLFTCECDVLTVRLQDVLMAGQVVLLPRWAAAAAAAADSCDPSEEAEELLRSVLPVRRVESLCRRLARYELSGDYGDSRGGTR